MSSDYFHINQHFRIFVVDIFSKKYELYESENEGWKMFYYSSCLQFYIYYFEGERWRKNAMTEECQCNAENSSVLCIRIIREIRVLEDTQRNRICWH